MWPFIKKILFALDPERAHRLTVHLLRYFSVLGPAPLRLITGAEPASQKRESHQVLGLAFSSRVGLAAGFDKDAELVRELPEMGFGFVEIGTITPRPQPGNDKPRLFRKPEERSLFNRMGFNSSGAQVVSKRLAQAREAGLPPGFIVGVNVGKNKDTPLESAHRDYADAVAAFNGLADYLVINVSSPNTPGLRSLQAVESLRPIIDAVQAVISKWSKRPPLLLKLAPEVTGEELARTLRTAEGWGINGWVLTNTLGGTREGVAGGWSGGVLVDVAFRSLRAARESTRLPIISVGGILSPEEAVRRIENGADLIQLYTGWVYGGPGFPARVNQALKSQKPRTEVRGF